MAETFGHWTVIGPAAPLPRSGSGYVPRVLARCRCDRERLVCLPNLKSGKSKSCGCARPARTAAAKTIHGDARKGAIAPEYMCWQAMIRRCANPENPDYGGRGITVCERWRSYPNFLADMGRRPSHAHSLDRYPDNDGPYEPDNCRWATSKQQRANQRRRGRLDQFTNDELVAELGRRGYHNPLRVPQHH